jgi:dipeptidyl aminopeptidase/acylaminoacyl peptidase
MKHRFVLVAIVFLSIAVYAQAPAPAEQTIKPPDNLVLEGIPPIPADLATTTLRYTEYRSAGILDWHPRERQMLIATRFADVPQVHLVKFPGGDRMQLTFFPDRINAAEYQPTRGDSFIFSKDVGGGEWYQFYRYDVATGDITLLTDGKSRNVGGLWSYSGDRFAYTSTRRNGKDLDLYVMNPADPHTDHMLAQLEGGGWQVLDWNPDDKRLLVMEFISAAESYLWLFDSATGEKTLITPKGGPEKISYVTAQFSKDGRGLYASTDKNSEFHRLVYIDLANKQHSVLSGDIKWDVENLELSHDGKALAFVVNEDGRSVLHLLDRSTRKERPAPVLPVGVIPTIRWHNNSRDLAVEINSARSPSDAYSVDTQNGKVDRWTFSETGGLNTANIPEPELVHWKTFDGRTLSGFHYRPPAKFTGKRPVIVNIHGGPEAQARPIFIGRNNYYLNELGIAILFPNVRGSDGYGKTFISLDNGFKREDSYKDIGALLDWIKTRPDLDGDRIMITGGSYGGHMTLAISTYYSDKIRCSVDVVGMSNLVTFLEHTEAYRRDLRRVEYGDERDPKMREFLERIAPMNNVQKITKPLFIVQGKNDPRVPMTESQQMATILKERHVPVWYLLANDEGHGFAKKKNQDFQFYATVEFIREYLLK